MGRSSSRKRPRQTARREREKVAPASAVESGTLKAILEYLNVRILALASVAIATFFSLGATPRYFLLCVAIFYLSVALLGGQLWISLAGRPVGWRITAIAGYLAAILMLSRGWIFRPAALEVFPTAYVPQYGPNSNVNGIEWLNNYSQLDLRITNPGEDKFENFAAELTTDLNIEDLRQTYGLGSCKVSTLHSYRRVTVQHFENGKPAGPMGFGEVDVDGKKTAYKVMPIYKDGTVGSPIGTDKTWQIWCPNFPPHSEIDFTAALSIPSGLEVPSSPCYLPAQPASWITLKSSFDDSGRQRQFVFSKCRAGADCKIERRFDLRLRPLKPDFL